MKPSPHTVLGLILAVLLAAGGICPSPALAADQAPRNPQGIQGMWVWQSQWVADPANRAHLLRFCDRFGFNRLLVQIHLADNSTAKQPVLEHPEALAALIAQAAKQGIKVEALDGAKDMAMAANQPRTLAILDAILAFNQTLPENARLIGIHYDIEPYIMDAWNAGPEQRQTIMRDLLTFYDTVRTKLDREAPRFTLAADIPFWYDSKTQPGDSCMIRFHGQVKNLHEHIQDLCDYIGIMSYRREATGPNSVVAHVQAELAYAEKIGKTICPALETIQLDSAPTITFFGLPAEQFWTVHNQVRQALGDRPGFGGMLTHSYRGLRDLLLDAAAPASE